MKRRFDNQAFTMVEILIVVAILTAMIAGGYVALMTGESTWFSTDANIEVQQNLRKAVEKMTEELAQSGLDQGGVAQYTIGDNTGVNGTDTIRFSIPVICHNGDSIIDTNTNVAYWRAPLTWGCSTSTCMDADDDCATVDYKWIEYVLDNSNQLIRRVLSPIGLVVRQDTIAQNISNLQISVSANLKNITLNITAQKNSAVNRLMTASTSVQVVLRN